MKRPALLAVAIWLVFAVSAAAATGPNIPWTTRDMTNAMKAIGYPKPHPKKLTCKGYQPSGGKFGSFKCVATYAHNRRRVFYTAGRGIGGWICAGARLATCKILSKGFTRVPSDPVPDRAFSGVAEVAASGYVTDHYGVADPKSNGGCTKFGFNTWLCGYRLSDGTTIVPVRITFAGAKGGYIITATTRSSYP